MSVLSKLCVALFTAIAVSACHTLLIDTMEPCSIERFALAGVTFDAHVNCTNTDWRVATQAGTPVLDEFDKMIIKLLRGDNDAVDEYEVYIDDEGFEWRKIPK